MPTGAELFVRTLAQLEISQVFTLVGDHLNEVLLETARADIRIVDMRHEAAVVHAADAMARLTRKPALTLVTGGPGHTNSLTGIATAFLNCSPVIAVSGSLAANSADRNAFQDIEQVDMTRPVVKWAGRPTSPAQVPFYLGRAYNEANSGRKGPVHLTIPVDVFTGQTDQASHAPAPLADPIMPPDPRQITRAIAALKSARHPVIIAGSGIWWADACDELRRFVELTSLPVYTITMAKGAISDEHPLCLGYADPALNKAVHKAFKEADLFLVLGKRIDYRLALGGPRLFNPAARFIQVDIHPQELGLNRPLEIGICADAKTTLQALIAEAAKERWKPLAWLEQLRAWKREWETQLAAQIGRTLSPMHPAAFFDEFRKCAPKNLLYSWDGGDVVHWGRATHPMTEPGRWVRLGPLGTIGAGLPNGLAVQLANPGKPVAVITGDGSLGFYIAEMDSAVRHNLPIVIIVGNDAGWGIERELQGGGQTVACELRRTRYDLIMQGFGGGGETIDTLDQVRPAIERAFASGIPYCLNVNVTGVRSPFTEWQIAGKKEMMLLREMDGATAIVTLNRPDRRNALSLELMRALVETLDELGRRREVRAVILAAAGNVFSSGHDLGEMTGRGVGEYREIFDVCTKLMEKIQEIPQPVIAEVQGIATAAGCQLAATCDLVVASEAARFGTPGVKIGLFCSTPMVALSRAIGRKRAIEMLLTGDLIDARTAADWGLVNRVVAAYALRAEALGLATRIAKASPLTIGIGKQAFHAQIDLDQAKAYAYTKEVMTMNNMAADAQEGITAFLEKRTPCWSGK